MNNSGAQAIFEDRDLTGDEIKLLADLIVEEPDHYIVLGISREASAEEINQAYCEAVRNFHPLQNQTIIADRIIHYALSQAFTRLGQAYNTLSNRNRRKLYDATLDQPQDENDLFDDWSLSDFSQTVKPPARGKSLPHIPRDSMFNAFNRACEKRRVERVELYLPMKVTFDRRWQEMTESRDVSPLGIKFALEHSVEPGTLLRIEFPLPRPFRTRDMDDELYVVQAMVLYVTQMQGEKQVSAEFV